LTLRILVHDYAGHPFQIQLSRELAQRGHVVHHVYFTSDITPRGALAKRADDPERLTIRGIDIDGRFDKFSYWKRLRYEREYGAKVAAYLEEVAPDLVVNTNVPLDALAIIQRRGSRPGRRFVVWVQDVISVGVRNVLRKKLPLAGELVAWRYARLERANLRAADRVVCITEDFQPILARWEIPPERCEVIENWAPLDEISPLAQDNAWARAHGLAGKQVVLYSGTLGLKHDPAGIAMLARHCAARPETVFVVVSEGPGAAWLREAKSRGGLGNLLLLPFQPYDRLAEVLASASVLLAVIEPEAGVFAVPSKVLSYLCASRAMLLSVPPENLAARTALRAEAGLVVRPGDTDGLKAALDRLLDDDVGRERMGRSGRAYAERSFDIRLIADRFERAWRDDLEASPSRAAA
jgi:colanic acid biosynthesis glycosyl transferase WcaI